MGTVEEPGRSFGTIGHFRCSGSHPKAQGRETGVGRIRPVQLAHSPLHAHTFLFMCLACNVPIAISRIRPERNLETIESRKFDLKCEYCNESSAMPAAMAKAHWVTDWA